MTDYTSVPSVLFKEMVDSIPCPPNAAAPNRAKAREEGGEGKRDGGMLGGWG
jgi:hypothetical protein